MNPCHDAEKSGWHTCLTAPHQLSGMRATLICFQLWIPRQSPIHDNWPSTSTMHPEVHWPQLLCPVEFFWFWWPSNQASSDIHDWVCDCSGQTCPGTPLVQLSTSRSPMSMTPPPETYGEPPQGMLVWYCRTWGWHEIPHWHPHDTVSNQTGILSDCSNVLPSPLITDLHWLICRFHTMPHVLRLYIFLK